MSPDKLVYTANQIGKFFANQGEGRRSAALTDYLVKFWHPRMRVAIIKYTTDGGDKLSRSSAKQCAVWYGRAEPGTIGAASLCGRRCLASATRTSSASSSGNRNADTGHHPTGRRVAAALVGIADNPCGAPAGFKRDRVCRT